MSPNKKFIKIFDKLENAFEKDSILNRPSTVNYQNFNFIRQQVSTYILNRRFPIHLKRLTLTKPFINNYSRRSFSNFKLVKDGYEKYYKQILEKCEKRNDEKSGKKIPFKLKKSPKSKSTKCNQEEEKTPKTDNIQKCMAEESVDSCEQAEIINEKCIRLIDKSRPKKAEKCKDARKECQRIVEKCEHDVQKCKEPEKLAKDEKLTKPMKQENQLEFLKCDRNQETIHLKKKNPTGSSNPKTTSTDDSTGSSSNQRTSISSSTNNFTTNETSKVKSKMEFLVSCIKKHSSDSLKSYLFKRSDRNENKISRNPSSYNKPRYIPKMNASYEDIKPDPLPPPSAHWSEKMKKRQNYNKYKPPIKPTTMEYIPYEEYNKNKKAKTLKRKSDEVKRVPKIIHIDEESCRSPMCKKRAISLKERNKKPNSRYQFSTIDKSVDSKIDVYKKPRKSNKNQSVCESKLQQQGDMKSMDGHLIRRKRNENYKSNGEWKSQKYKVRLKIYKTKNSLDPCLPVMVEVRRHFCDEGVDFKGESGPFLNFKA